MATVGTGKYTYDVIENWGKLPQESVRLPSRSKMSMGGSFR
jgi:hypothetical protein